MVVRGKIHRWNPSIFIRDGCIIPSLKVPKNIVLKYINKIKKGNSKSDISMFLQILMV